MPVDHACGAVEPLHSAWLDGELSRDERDRVARHLQRCGSCRAAVDGLDRTRALLAAAPVRAVPPAVARAMRTAVPVPGTRPESPSHRPGRLATLAVGLLGVVGAAAFALGGPAPAPREVAVPVDLFVADHVVRSVAGPVSTPVLVER